MVTLPDEMRAVVVYEPGGPEVLRLERRPVPPVREGWSLVHVRARGLNHSEVFTRKGLSLGEVPAGSGNRVRGGGCIHDRPLSSADWGEGHLHHGRDGS